MRFIYSIQRSFIEYRVNLRKLWKLSLFKNYKISQFLPKITDKYNINLQGSLRYELRWEFLYFPWVVYTIAHNWKGIEWEILENSKLFLNPVHIVLERKHDLTRGWLVLILGRNLTKVVGHSGKADSILPSTNKIRFWRICSVSIFFLMSTPPTFTRIFLSSCEVRT